MVTPQLLNIPWPQDLGWKITFDCGPWTFPESGHAQPRSFRFLPNIGKLIVFSRCGRIFGPISSVSFYETDGENYSQERSVETTCKTTPEKAGSVLHLAFLKGSMEYAML